jgi:N-acetylmuramoyl-L-alanine amidase
MRFLLATAALLLTSSVVAFDTTEKVVVDPGHGGTDAGHSASGVTEAQTALATALRLKHWLDADSFDVEGGGTWQVSMTRSTDVAVSLSSRVSYANAQGAARFLSVHANGNASTSTSGLESVSASGASTTAQTLRNRVYEEAGWAWPIAKRGANNVDGTGFLSSLNAPAAQHLLGFVTNAGDRTYLSSVAQRDRAAEALLFGLQRSFGTFRYSPQGNGQFVIDNETSSFAASANWSLASSTPGFYGQKYSVRSTAAVTDSATWTFPVQQTGTYRIDAWWTSGANRAAAAPFVVVHAGGSTTVQTNQQANGGRWNTLGTYTFNQGTGSVRLSCWTTAGFFVVADAVRIVKVN